MENFNKQHSVDRQLPTKQEVNHLRELSAFNVFLSFNTYCASNLIGFYSRPELKSQTHNRITYPGK